MGIFLEHRAFHLTIEAFEHAPPLGHPFSLSARVGTSALTHTAVERYTSSPQIYLPSVGPALLAI